MTPQQHRKKLDHERYMRDRENRIARQKAYYREHWHELKCKRLGIEMELEIKKNEQYL